MTEPPKPPVLWDAVDVATHLGISKAHVYRLARENRIPKIRVGRLMRFVPTDVHAWLDAKTTKAVK